MWTDTYWETLFILYSIFGANIPYFAHVNSNKVLKHSSFHKLNSMIRKVYKKMELKG